MYTSNIKFSAHCQKAALNPKERKKKKNYWPGPEFINFFRAQLSLDVLLINLKLLTLTNSALLNIAEHKTFSANKYEKASYLKLSFICITEMKCVPVSQSSQKSHSKNYDLSL